ncbi:MAG: ABC transporter substrate-binding protein [Acidobacteria bacterium]|nr:MAG: ABC transporter substrate-binding protein [Acidobacteriota bacterium]
MSGFELPVSGNGAGASFTGTILLQKFVASGGGIAAVGTMIGKVSDALGTVTTVAQNVQAAVNIGAATGEILHLDIGPISLVFRGGPHVNLSEIVLDITAQEGDGNRLGNLLCAVADLLARPGALARILNDILGIIASDGGEARGGNWAGSHVNAIAWTIGLRRRRR